MNPLRAFIDPLFWHRISSALHRKGMRSLSHFIDHGVRWWFVCFVPGSAQIGVGTRLGYGGMAIVIHKAACLGNRVIVGPGVVIGGNGIQQGVPVIGDDVLIGAGAKLLGPIRVGHRAHIGANAVVLTDVPDDATAVGVPARVKRA